MADDQASAWPQGASEMAARIRTHDWVRTPLGPIQSWPQSLKTTVDLMLACGHAMQIAWGSERTVLYNDAYAPMLMDRHPDALGLSFRDVWFDNWDEIEPLVDRVFAGETVRFEAMPLVTTRRGYPEETWWTFSYSPVRGEVGEIAGLLNVPVDVTRRVRGEQAEAALRESEARHRLLIGSWAQAVWETDPSGVIVADSPSWRAYKGQSLEEWLGYGWLNAIHSDDRAYAERHWREAIAARSLVNAEFRLRAPDGGWRWTNVRAAPVLDAAGNIEKWAGMNIDIDARRRADAALQESEAKFRTVFETIDRAFVIQEVIRDDAGLAIDMRYVEINPAFTRQTGLGPGIVGKLLSEVMPDVERFFIDIHDRVARTGSPERFENYNQSTGRWYDAHITAIGGEGRLAASVFEDVSARKLAEIALRKSEERQVFLLALSDALRGTTDPVAMQERATTLLGLHLGVDRCVYAEFLEEQGEEYVLIEREYRTAQTDSFIGRHTLHQFGPDGAELKAGRDIVVVDTELEDVPEAQRAVWRALRVRARLGLPLVRGGRPVVGLGVHSATPRDWSRKEVSLIREVGERTWEAIQRARAETALRNSEEKYRTLFETMGQGFIELEVIRDKQGHPFDLHYIELRVCGDSQS